MTKKNTFTESKKDIPIIQHADVIVCGAGPAGIAAALAAARTGAKTCLLEVNGCLGGVWTAGMLSWVIDPDESVSIMTEIINKLDERGARGVVRVKNNSEQSLEWADEHIPRETTKNCNFSYDVEQMKLLLEQMCTEAGISIQLHTRVVAAGCDTNNRLSVAITESKSGRQAWAGKVFIDCTGDGDLAAQVGCGFDLGHPETGKAQPMSLMALLTGIHKDNMAPFFRGKTPGHKERFLEQIRLGGVDPSYGGPTLIPVREDFFALMANHEYGVSALDAEQITAATLQARSEVHKIVDALSSVGGIWENIKIIATGSQIGVREGRRVHGRYTVSKQDMIDGKRHEDAVCHSTFGIDVHSTDESKGKKTQVENKTKTHPYDIPLRALIAKDVDGLMMAGRCISGDFFAHSSYRVTGNAVGMGQAAGVAAAVATNVNKFPHELLWQDVKNKIDELG